MEKYPVLILRTFSKATVSRASGRIRDRQAEFVSFSRHEAALQHQPHRHSAARAAAGRVRLAAVLANNRGGESFYYESLTALNLEYTPTEANFVLVKLGPRAEEITKRLFERKVLVRFMGAYGLPDSIRISFGTPYENTRCIEELKRLV
jgi:histidinol-phosphate aminotransferase